jgi:hypothetical protein
MLMFGLININLILFRRAKKIFHEMNSLNEIPRGNLQKPHPSSVVDPNPDPDSMGSRIQEGKNDPEKFKTVKINFIF